MKRLVQIGNSYGVILPLELRRQNNLGKKSEIDFRQTKEGILIVKKKKVKSGINTKFAKMVDDFITEHEDVLKELAHR